jgi:hypothetical protein
LRLDVLAVFDEGFVFTITTPGATRANVAGEAKWAGLEAWMYLASIASDKYAQLDIIYGAPGDNRWHELHFKCAN